MTSRNKEEQSIYNKEYRAKNKDTLRQYNKEYKEKNKDVLREKIKTHRAKPETKNRANEYSRKRYKQDSAEWCIRASIQRCLRKDNIRKNTKTSRMLGRDVKEVVAWAKAQGYKPYSGLHIDHIIPCDWWRKNHPQQLFTHGFAIANLQIITAEENISKSDKLPHLWKMQQVLRAIGDEVSKRREFPQIPYTQ